DATLPVTNVMVLDSSTISAVTPSVASAAGPLYRSVDVRVTTGNGTSAATSVDEFTYQPTGPIPTVTSVSPSSGPATGGTTMLITGSGFTGATSVSIGIPVTTFTVLDDGTISAVTPNVLNAATGQANFGMVDVRVTTSGGQSSAPTAVGQFTY